MSARTPLVPSDLVRFVVAGDPQLAPDGETVVYRRTAFDLAADAVTNALWLARPGAPPRPFTAGRTDRLPRISPDCALLAFVRDVESEPRIFLMSLAGGEPQALGGACTGISSLAWSPDGRCLAFTAAAPFDPTTAHIAVDEPSGARHIRALPYKSDQGGLLNGRCTQLFTLDIAAETVRQLTYGDADVGSATWSPDGRTLAVAIGVGRESTMRSDIALVDVASGALRRVTNGDGPHGAPTFSPDGRALAWYGHAHGDDTRYAGELLVANLDGSERRSLSAALDRHIGDTIGGDLRTGGIAPPCWRNAHEVLALLSDGASSSVRAFDTGTGAVEVVAGGAREIYGFASSASGPIAIAYSTPVEPSVVALVTSLGEARLTADNAWLAEKLVVAPEPLAVRAADGTALEAWIIAPPATESAPAPVVLEIHGGPHATYGHTFFFEFQLLVGRGFAVVYGNPRGGAAYGQAFASAITADWGGVDAADVLSILDAALAARPLDGTRVAAVGGSYGGFMTTWLLGHSERFVTGISMRACNDFPSFTGGTDIGFFLEAELGLGPSPDGMRGLFERSPMRAVAAIDAPLLIMHSERDYRCPIDQGEQLFNILRMLGKSQVEFVRFTGDGHELSRGGKPRHRILRLRAIAHWLDRHLAGRAGDAQAGSLFRPLEAEDELPA